MQLNTVNKGVFPRSGIFRQIMLVMKITTVLIFAFLMQVSAAGLAQKITLNEKNASLESVIDKIRSQTGFEFVFNVKDVDKAKKVNLNVRAKELNEVLEELFEDQELSFSIKDKFIVLKAKERSFFERVVDQFQAIDVYGRVLTSDGQPLAGATVRVKNGKGSTITGSDGKFGIKGVEQGAVLVISYLGYLTKEIGANADLTGIVLVVSDNKLDEVQVIAYGTTSRRLNTGNTFTVKAGDIEKQPVTNPLLALQGRVPGLTIEQSTGFANAGVKVRIQGQNSIGKGNDPLYVIDGVPYFSQMLWLNTMPPLGQSGTSFDFGSGSGNPLSFINPASIESIDVLKDADATAIYGSRAANGAILITTKKGKVGATRFDMNVQSGAGKVTRELDLLNTQQYLSMRKEAFKNDGLSIPALSSTPSVYNYDLTVWDQDRYTDWQKELIGGTARYTDVQATISGGSATTQFLVGAGYHKQTTVFPKDFANTKGSLNFSINNVSPNQKFRVQLTGSYMADDNAVPSFDFTSIAMRMAPNAPALYNPDGSLNWAPAPNGASTWRNPVAFLEQSYTAKTNNLVGSALLSYQVLPGLDVKSSFGYTSLTTDEFSGFPNSFYAPEIRALRERTSSFAISKLSSWMMEPQLTYQRAFGNGTLNALLGGTLTQSSTKLVEIGGAGYSSDLLLQDLQSAAEVRYVNSQFAMYKYNAVFARVGYNLLDKYIVNITARRDGSSRFGPQNKLHNFGSIAGAWIFSEENLVKDHLPFLSFGKIRASYGTTGNDQIGNYQFLNEYAAVNVPVNYQGVPAIEPMGIPNPNLEWEETSKLQGGLELGFLKDRILINAGYYRNRSSNQLMGYDLPIITGFTSIPVINFPATLQNYGWELVLNTVNIKSKDFTWSSNLNLTLAKNKLIEFENLENSSYYGSFIIGQPITIGHYYKYLGVNFETGLYEIADKDGKPTTTPDILTDQTQIIDRSPEYFGGFQNSFRYKGLQLDFLLQFAKQMGPGYRGDRPGLFLSDNSTFAGGNQPISVLDRWQNPGDFTSYQRFSTYSFPSTASGTATNNALRLAGRSTFSYEDASYIRLKNIALSWDLPEAWTKKAHLKDAKLFLQGQNLLTFTKYSGLDPETKNSGTLPPIRVLTLGIKMGL